MLAMHCQDLVLNQHHHALDSTCYLTHPGGGAEACQGRISAMQRPLEMGKGWFLSQVLMRSRVVSVFTAPFARLGGEIHSFLPQVPNSLVKPTLTFGARGVTRGWELSKTNHGVQLCWPCTARIWS